MSSFCASGLTFRRHIRATDQQTSGRPIPRPGAQGLRCDAPQHYAPTFVAAAQRAGLIVGHRSDLRASPAGSVSPRVAFCRRGVASTRPPLTTAPGPRRVAHRSSCARSWANAARTRCRPPPRSGLGSDAGAGWISWRQPWPPPSTGSRSTRAVLTGYSPATISSLTAMPCESTHARSAPSPPRCLTRSAPSGAIWRTSGEPKA